MALGLDPLAVINVGDQAAPGVDTSKTIGALHQICSYRLICSTIFDPIIFITVRYFAIFYQLIVIPYYRLPPTSSPGFVLAGLGLAGFRAGLSLRRAG